VEGAEREIGSFSVLRGAGAGFRGLRGGEGGEVGWVVEGSSSSKDAKADTGSSENVGESAAFFWGEVLSIKDSMISTAVSKWDELMAC